MQPDTRPVFIPMGITMHNLGGNEARKKVNAELEIKYPLDFDTEDQMRGVEVVSLVISPDEVFRYCEHINEYVYEGALFCPHCGHRMFYHFQGEGCCEVLDCDCQGIPEEGEERVLDISPLEVPHLDEALAEERYPCIGSEFGVPPELLS